jgi:hypothetical protein
LAQYHLLRPGDVDCDIPLLLDLPLFYTARALTDTTCLLDDDATSAGAHCQLDLPGADQPHSVRRPAAGEHDLTAGDSSGMQRRGQGGPVGGDQWGRDTSADPPGGPRRLPHVCVQVGMVGAERLQRLTDRRDGTTKLGHPTIMSSR